MAFPCCFGTLALRGRLSDVLIIFRTRPDSEPEDDFIAYENGFFALGDLYYI